MIAFTVFLSAFLLGVLWLMVRPEPPAASPPGKPGGMVGAVRAHKATLAEFYGSAAGQLPPDLGPPPDPAPLEPHGSGVYAFVDPPGPAPGDTPAGGPGMDTPIDIRHHEAEGRGAFFVERDGARLAELAYTRDGASRVTATHTEVGDALRGQGVARKLVDALVGWARASGTHVTPVCSYVKAQAEKDASIRDVVG